MSSGGGIIICGGLGRLLGWFLMWMREHKILNVGIRLKDNELIAAGWTPLEAHMFGEIIKRDVEKWYKIAESRGVEYFEDEPFPGNLTSPVVDQPYPIPPPP